MIEVNGYSFYGEENQTQNRLIKQINDLFDPPIQEIEGGICYMLSMQFLLDYLGEKALLPPEEIFDRLTRNSVAYLRQIAWNFKAYIDSRFSLGNLKNQTRTYIDELSYRKYQGVLLQEFTSTNLPADLPMIDIPRRGHLIVFFFKQGTETYGHAVALVNDANGYALYDPNYGIYRLTSADPLTELYAFVIPTLYSPTGEVETYVFAVNKWKID